MYVFLKLKCFRQYENILDYLNPMILLFVAPVVSLVGAFGPLLEILIIDTNSNLCVEK